MDDYRHSILVVDDERAIRTFLGDLLRGEYRVDTAEDGHQALEKLAAARYDIVITDIKMPEFSGIDLLEAIDREDLDVVMMTGNADVESAIAALKMGAYDYIRKPFDIDEILLAVDRIVQKQRLVREACRYRDHLEEMVQERTRQYRELVLNMMKCLVRTLEFKDQYTKYHSENVARYATALAIELGFDEETTKLITTAGVLHDLGKIGVRDSVLQKPGKLTAEEFEHVKKHPVISADILEPVIDEPYIIAAVRHHHEAWDGSGYPDGLAGEGIPIGARVLTVADCYDAMCSNRSYRRAMAHEEALRRIREASGQQFDAAIAAVFLRLDFEPLRDSIAAREPLFALGI